MLIAFYGDSIFSGPDARIRDLGTEDLYRDLGTQDPNCHALCMYVQVSPIAGLVPYIANTCSLTALYIGVINSTIPAHILHPLELIKYMHTA